tara:strand:+ start:72 stop:470 length:399 start_codon:yes stop_codon:yes gene_type:complete
MPSSNAQRIGWIAETLFIAECLERDFEPHPTTTPMPWDFIVHCPSGDLKVQVKSTAFKEKNSYNVNVGAGFNHKSRMSEDVDVVAVYIMPLKEWWMIPRDKLGGKTLRLMPDKSSQSRFKPYQNNWSIYYNK